MSDYRVTARVVIPRHAFDTHDVEDELYEQQERVIRKGDEDVTVKLNKTVIAVDEDEAKELAEDGFLLRHVPYEVQTIERVREE